MKTSQDHPSLLLLPAPPSPATRDSLNAAYRPSLEAAISKCRQKNQDGATVLVVALVGPILAGPYRYSKTLNWHHAQSLVAGVYTIASAVCAELAIDAHINAGPGSVDVRVLLVDRQRGTQDGKPVTLPPDARAVAEPNNTAVVDLSTFAAAHYPWTTIYHCGTEAGLGLFADYLRLAEGKQILRQDQLVAVPGGVTMNDPSSSGGGGGHSSSESLQTTGHAIVCIGGTFDHLHSGHKLLLTGGALLLDIPRTDEGNKPACFIVGITGDELLKNKKYAQFVQPWDHRARGVINFLASLLCLSPEETRPTIAEEGSIFRARLRDGAVEIMCTRIQDAFGPTITMPEVSSLVVSAETRAGGKAVNDKRAELGWAPLEIFEVDVLDAGDVQSSDEPTQTVDFASKISSTAIRKLRAESKTS